MRALTALLLPPALAVLAGCTPLQWVRADATPEQLAQDSMHCQQEAWREARLRAWHFRPLGPVPFRDSTGRHFLGWSYDPWADPFGDPYMEEGRLAQFCMRSKGYELQPIEKPPAAAPTK
jgi:hypothetical protein